MYPYLKSKDTLNVEMFPQPMPFSEIIQKESPTGRVFFYRCENGEMVSHRYIGVHQQAFLFKGDWTYQVESYKDLFIWGVVHSPYQNQIHQQFWSLSLFCFLQKKMCFSKCRAIRILCRGIIFLLSFLNRQIDAICFATSQYRKPDCPSANP